MHMLSYYQKLYGIDPDHFPGARDCDQYTMALPLHSLMTAEDYQYVVKAVKELS